MEQARDIFVRVVLSLASCAIISKAASPPWMLFENGSAIRIERRYSFNSNPEPPALIDAGRLICEVLYIAGIAGLLLSVAYEGSKK